ncbi:prepilin peptidase [Streptomyces sp. NPDC006879]|uniref:prepilin peptidase n=1 Tax=Streptomyces sp. NPDC006879 TaxID=3364767 RepID=UPI003692C21A
MLPLLIVLAAGYGAAAGLLLPRAAYRLSVAPGQPWRVACPVGHPLSGPAGAWLGAARCASCGPTGASGYGRGATGALPLVSALACALLAAAAGPRPEALVWVLLTPVTVLLATVDLAVHRLPDVLTLPLAGAVTVLLGAAALSPNAGGSWRLAVLGGLVLAGGYLLLFLVQPAAMGFGDVKLALALGVALGWYGWGVLLLGAFAGFLYGALNGLALVLMGRADRRTPLPFGPFMAAGALTGLLLGGFGA